MPYQGQIPGIGAPGTAGGDFTAGADLGLPGYPWNPSAGLTIELPPGTYPTPGGGTVTQPPRPVPTPTPSPPPSAQPIEVYQQPNVHAGPVDVREGGVVEPPADSYHDYEGYYDPATEPAPEYRSGVVIEGELDVPHPKPGGWSPGELLQSAAESVLARVIGRVFGGPVGYAIQEVLTPSELDPDPDVRGLPGVFGAAPSAPRAPQPVTSSPGTPAPARGPRPTRPTLPPVPQSPTIGVPKPEIQPWSTPSSPTAPRETPPFSPGAPSPVSRPTTSAPQPATSSQPQPQSPTQPNNSNWPWLLTGFLPSLLSPSGRTPFPSVPTAAAPTPASTTSPLTTSSTSPAADPFAPTPPLTPINALGVESPPAGESCETPQQQKQRRQSKRDSCEKFITVVVPRHHRRICAAEAGKLLGKKLGRKIGSLVGREVRGVLKSAGVPLAKLPKRKRIPRSIEIGGGFGVELPRMPGAPR